MTVVGCSGRSETYSVSVKNDTKSPLTIGFTKVGSPYQEEFMSPEDIGLDPQVNPETHAWGMPVAPGKTASTKHPMTANLSDAESVAYLRVYRGEPNLLEIMSISRGSSSRVDLPLMPGQNNVRIIERDGKLAAIKTP